MSQLKYFNNNNTSTIYLIYDLLKLYLKLHIESHNIVYISQSPTSNKSNIPAVLCEGQRTPVDKVCTNRPHHLSGGSCQSAPPITTSRLLSRLSSFINIPTKILYTPKLIPHL